MPVNEASSYHGYDATDYYRVEPDYGTNDDSKRLVVEAHRRQRLTRSRSAKCGTDSIT